MFEHLLCSFQSDLLSVSALPFPQDDGCGFTNHQLPSLRSLPDVLPSPSPLSHDGCLFIVFCSQVSGDAKGPRGQQPSQTFPMRCSLNSSGETNEDEYGGWVCRGAEGMLGLTTECLFTCTDCFLLSVDVPFKYKHMCAECEAGSQIPHAANFGTQVWFIK